jgi:meiotically up-regulated gene 157 (Mug157) protein
MNRRQFAFRSVNTLAALSQMSRGVQAVAQSAPSPTLEQPSATASSRFDPTGRPPLAQRTFTSDAVDDSIARIKSTIRNPQLATLFENCYPNTLDTTVQVSERNGKPDTFIITGDIPAMWLRDSSAQVLPYVKLAPKDPKLQLLFRGLMHRQADCILLDSYANAFYATRKLGVFATDITEMRPGVHERKWEIDSLCYAIRLAYSYWSATGDAEPFDNNWHLAARRIVATFREQQRLINDGPYRFQRPTTMFYDNSPNRGLGNPTRKIGLLHSAFRPSDDACLLPFLVPSNMFAVVSMRQLHQLATSVLHDQQLADDAAQLADTLQATLQKYAVVSHPAHGKIYAYEIDGFGNSLLMDDANVPSLLALPYLGCCDITDPTYRQTRAFVLSDDNPYFFRGVAEGIGGPHVGPGMIWPLSIIMRAMTSNNQQEIESCLRTLLATNAGTGFMHESFNAQNPNDYTRPWFAWCNSLFGELIVRVSTSHPAILGKI